MLSINMDEGTHKVKDAPDLRTSTLDGVVQLFRGVGGVWNLATVLKQLLVYVFGHNRLIRIPDGPRGRAREIMVPVSGPHLFHTSSTALP